MIGFFDSGFGGLQTLKYFHDTYPQYDYLFLADTKNCPYGEKSGEEIKKFTFAGLHWLFDHGAKIVILACNTAAAYAVRDWQTQFPHKKVLSITIPGVESILHKQHPTGNIGILATTATIRSNIYTDLFFRFGGEGNPAFQFVMAPKLVELVEQGCENTTIIKTAITNVLESFSNISHLILGCTHFPVYMNYFTDLFPGEIINPSWEATKRFGPYLKNHPEIAHILAHHSTINCYTTGNPETFQIIGSRIFGQGISATHSEID